MANQLDLANAQLIGFKFGKWYRDDIVELIKSMGLTKKEWEDLKEDYPVDSDVDEDDFQKIEQYFKNLL